MNSAATINSTTLRYSAGGKNLLSHLYVNEKQQASRAGVVVLGEWWGMNDHLQKQARRLAELGYVTLAADVYGDGYVANNPAEAKAAMDGLFGNMTATAERLTAAVNALAARPEVDASRLGAMGYCLGGALSLHAARIGLPLLGVVSFHGALSKTHAANKGEVRAAVLICHGDEDKLISAADFAGFREEMKTLELDWTLKVYPGAMHGFTNPGATEKGKKYDMPLKYNAQADKQSWADMTEFWARVLA